MGESWIVSNLNAALSTWNDKLAEIWSLLTESPQTFKGRASLGRDDRHPQCLAGNRLWAARAFFCCGRYENLRQLCGSQKARTRPKAVHPLCTGKRRGDLRAGIDAGGFSIVQGMVSTIITQSGNSGMSSVTLPQELIDAINNVGFWDSIPLWAVTLIGGLLITVLSFTMILTVYGRMFSLWMYAAIAPIPLSTFAGGAHQQRRQKLHPQLRRCMFAGRGDCLVLHYFLRHLVQPSRRGYRCICCHRCSGPMLENWRSTCWCWWEPSRAVTAS